MKIGLKGAPFDWEYELKLSKLLSLKILEEMAGRWAGNLLATTLFALAKFD